MTDEETDSEDEGAFIKRSLTWRSVKCDQLINKLDERYMQQRDKKRNTKPLKPRKVGSQSERCPPRNVLDWAVHPGEETADPSSFVSPTTPNTSSSLEGDHDSRRSASTPNNSVNSLSSPPLTPISNDESDDEFDNWLSSVVKRVQ